MNPTEMTQSIASKVFPACRVWEEKHDEHITIIRVEDAGDVSAWSFDDREQFIAQGLDRQEIYRMRAREATRSLFDLKLWRGDKPSSG